MNARFGRMGFSRTWLAVLGATALLACGGRATEQGPAGTSPAGAAAEGGSGGTLAVAGALGFAGASHVAGAGGSVSLAGQGGAIAENKFPCRNPVSLGGGTVACDGFKHFAESTACPSKLPRAGQNPLATPGSGCQSDADCVNTPNGFCDPIGQSAILICKSGCESIDQCPSPGFACECGALIGQCVSVDGCHADRDCLPGYLCRSYDAGHGCGEVTDFYLCQTPDDECGADSDCPAGELCAADPSVTKFVCVESGCLGLK